MANSCQPDCYYVLQKVPAYSAALSGAGCTPSAALSAGWPGRKRKGLGRAGAQVREVGDGNINYVYIVEGPAGGLVLKQGLPYLRIAHDWPLTQVLLRPFCQKKSTSLTGQQTGDTTERNPE